MAEKENKLVSLDEYGFSRRDVTEIVKNFTSSVVYEVTSKGFQVSRPNVTPQTSSIKPLK